MEYFQQNWSETVEELWKFLYDSRQNSRINIPDILIMSLSTSIITDQNQCDSILLLHQIISGYYNVIEEHNHSTYSLISFLIYFFHFGVFQVCLWVRHIMSIFIFHFLLTHLEKLHCTEVYGRSLNTHLKYISQTCHNQKIRPFFPIQWFWQPCELVLSIFKIFVD